MKPRFGTPRYAPVWTLGFAAGAGLLWLSDHVSDATALWTQPLGGLILAVALSVRLAGSIAERRAWEAQHKAGGH